MRPLNHSRPKTCHCLSSLLFYFTFFFLFIFLPARCVIYAPRTSRSVIFFSYIFYTYTHTHTYTFIFYIFSPKSIYDSFSGNRRARVYEKRKNTLRLYRRSVGELSWTIILKKLRLFARLRYKRRNCDMDAIFFRLSTTAFYRLSPFSFEERDSIPRTRNTLRL